MDHRITDITGPVDLAVIGAGPAGLNAAITAGEAGLEVLLIDEQAQAGGQIYHGLLHTPLAQKTIASVERRQIRALTARLAATKVRVMTDASVWSLDPVGEDGFELGVVQGDIARLLRARRVVLAGGAMERSVPMPGWTLPGVMTAGAVQRALKAQGLVPQGRIILAGSGPLLRLVAHQLSLCGLTISAILDTAPRGRLREALPALLPFLTSALALKALPLLRPGGRGVRRFAAVQDISIEGTESVEGVSFHAGGKIHRLGADVVLLHQGLVPDVTLARTAGCRLEWDKDERTFRPSRTDELDGSIPGIAIAGDGGGIGGAALAALEGEIAGLVAARASGRIRPAESTRRLARLQERRRHLQAARAFPDRLFRPAIATFPPARADTIICRCESVQAGDIFRLAKDPRLMPDQIKVLSRCGMGPCHGRQCLGLMTEIVAQMRGLSPDDIGLPRARGPVTPLRLGTLAALDWTEETHAEEPA